MNPGPKQPRLMLVGECQILPQIVQVAGRIALGSVIALAAEHPDEAVRVRSGPDCDSPAPADHVVCEGRAVGKGYGYGRKHGVLVDVADSVPPDPLPGAVLILPGIVQESSWVRGRRAVSPTTEEPKIIIGVNPSGGAPTRSRDTRCRTGTQVAGSLGAVDTGLIRKIIPGHPNPLLRRYVVLPQVVQDRPGRRRTTGAGPDRVESKSSEKPNVAGGVDP